MNKYVIIDLEMCHVSKGEKLDTFGHGQELIQIGAVLLDKNFETADTFMTYVHPEFGVVDSYIERFTKISPAQVKDAPSAAEALKALENWLPDDAVIVSWSDTDKIQFIKEAEGKHIHIPKLESFFETWIDCQATFSEKMHEKRRYNLKEALDLCGIYYEEGLHNALVDAKNTARLFKKMEEEDVIVLSPYFISAEAASSMIFDPFARKTAKKSFAY